MTPNNDVEKGKKPNTSNNKDSEVAGSNKK
ncbi:hypothetical protein FHS18_004829 [Paenibacillus phyllosphaerae]|uniref:Uncharacterized protein n=1 Tax=Paenibacillus phyllosphaerae TaxID=274593 RepID=A0A7W5B1W7_9BACL|nr:hypothetical protein [Paenibacillus phyllosphaerae]